MRNKGIQILTAIILLVSVLCLFACAPDEQPDKGTTDTVNASVTEAEETGVNWAEHWGTEADGVWD